MYIVTGGAGFIGSNLVYELNQRGESEILVVDNLEKSDKFLNLRDCYYADYMDKRDFLIRLERGQFNHTAVSAIFHQGACSDTMEYNGRYMMDNNFHYSKVLFHFAVTRKIPFVYASSAATYGNSTRFNEDPENEQPLNIYGYSKLFFDRYVARHWSTIKSPIAGLRYFNVYGPREHHKGRMASMVHQLYHQVRSTQVARLFAGFDGYADGEQQRDFIHVADVVAVNLALAQSGQVKGVFNVGTGVARSFNDLARILIRNLGDGRIEYIPAPDSLRAKYQNFTQADLTRLRAAGYQRNFLSLEDGIAAFVQKGCHN